MRRLAGLDPKQTIAVVADFDGLDDAPGSSDRCKAWALETGDVRPVAVTVLEATGKRKVELRD